MLPSFDVLRPDSLDQALELLASIPRAFPLAGGTNLLVDARAGRVTPQTVIDLSRLDELRGIKRSGNEIVIGATTTIAEILDDPIVGRQAPVLQAACKTFANPLIRNRATVGGNLSNNAPCADTVPALLVLEADVELACVSGIRRMPLETFVVEPFRTKRQANELLTAVRFRIPPTAAIGRFRKVGLRKISCMAKVDVAVMADLDPTGVCREARIALAAASPVALRARDAEQRLAGRRWTDRQIEKAAAAAAQASAPRQGSEYKQTIVAGLVRRLLSEIAREAGETHG